MVCGVPPLSDLMQAMAGPLRLDAGTQTPTHLNERLIDINYEWNEWALRRRVSQLRGRAGQGRAGSCGWCSPCCWSVVQRGLCPGGMC
jgi:hypothetical protein